MIAAHRVIIHGTLNAGIVYDTKRRKEAKEDTVEFAVAEQVAKTHAVADAIGEYGGVWVLYEAFGIELKGVVPYFRV